MRRAIVLVLVVAAFALATLATVAMAGVVVGLGGRPAAASETGSQLASTGATAVAQAGDSLWSIAVDHHGDVGVNTYVDALIDLNGGTAIQAGQAIRLP